MEIPRARLLLLFRPSFISASTRKCNISRTFGSHCLFSTAQAFQMDQFEYACDVDAEPLHRYRAGGYHPVRLGDLLEDGRYKVLRKLGWGGYSTVWAARDQRSHRLPPLSNIKLTNVGHKSMLH